jgi:hypothetical protein
MLEVPENSVQAALGLRGVRLQRGFAAESLGRRGSRPGVIKGRGRNRTHCVWEATCSPNYSVDGTVIPLPRPQEDRM